MKYLATLFVTITLLLSGCIPSNETDASGKLFEAIRAHDLNNVKRIVTETSIDLDPPTQPNMVNKALAYASIYGDLEIVKYILDQGVEIDGKIAYGGTALLRAMEVNNNDISEFLIESGADVNIPNAFGVSPMIGSAISGNIKLMELIISHGGDIDKAHKVEVSQNYGELAYNPIQWAVVRNNTDCVAFLIQAGADLKIKTHQGESLLELANKRSNTDIIKLIENKF
ncbi:ankyrin repeat domain-containing protein [Candidatus Electrothrix sp.]|uniref:ankyrin repeat domain-containing protein n=1 Tax=Candidatus Electrothrix sp. TaxID=2170559 RepID=UPI004055A8F0